MQQTTRNETNINIVNQKNSYKYAKSYNESAQKEKRFACFQAATLEQDPEKRIEYIKNEGDEYIKAKNLSPVQKTKKFYCIMQFVHI